METILENETITAKKLMFFIGLPCVIYDLLPNGEINENVLAPAVIEGIDVALNEVIAERINYKPEQVKPILKRMSDLTIEDTVFISCNILNYDEDPDQHETWHNSDLNDIKEFGFIQFATHDSIFMPNVIEYFIHKGFDIGLLPHGSYLLQNKNGIATSE